MATDKIEVDMRTLQQVVYDGKDCNGLIIDGCGWRKPYSAKIPTNITGVQSITITRSVSESNCGQMPIPSTLSSNGTVLYGDTVTVTAEPIPGYEITTQPTFKSGVTNGKVTGAVELNAPVAKRTQYKISFGSLAYGTWRINSASGYTGYVPYGSTWSIANYLSTDLRNQMVLTMKDPDGNILFTADYERPASDNELIELYYNVASNGLAGTYDSYVNGSLTTASSVWPMWKNNYRFSISESSSSGTITGNKTFAATVTKEPAALTYTTVGTDGAANTSGFRILKVAGYFKDIRSADKDNMIGLMEQYIHSETHSAACYFEFDNSTLPTTLTANTTLTPVVKQYMRMKTVTLAVSPAGYGTTVYGTSNITSLSVPYGTKVSSDTSRVAFVVDSAAYPYAVNNKINGSTEAIVTSQPKSADGTYTYASNGWTNGSGTVTSNITVTAKFTNTPYRVIRIENTSWGTVKYGSTPLTSNARVPDGATLVVEATQVTGSFTEASCSTGTLYRENGVLCLKVDGDETITFTRTEYVYSLTYHAKPTGVKSYKIYKNGALVCENPTSTSGFDVKYSDKVYAVVEADTGYKVDVSGISTNASSPTTNFTGNVNITVTAQKLKYVITIENPSYGTVKNGSVTIASGNEVEHGTTLVLNPTQITGYTTKVSSSTGTPSGEMGGTFVVDGPETITFTRTGNTYTIKYHNTAGAVWQTDSRVYPAAATIRTNSFTKNQETMFDYTVTYNYNGGTGSPASAQAKRIKSYLANGWKNTDGTTFQDGESFSSAMNLTLQPAFTSTTSGGSVTLPSATRTGYTFITWDDGGMEGAGGAGDSYEPRSNVTLTASWRANKYTVKFYGNGATSGSMSDQSFTYDQAQNLTAEAFTRAYTVTYNYNGNGSSNTTATATSTFNGWATRAAGEKVYNDQQSVSNLTTTNNGTVNLYAHWTPGTTKLPTPTRTGYTCNGWYTSASGGTKVGDTGATYTPTGNITLYAQWTPNTHWVFYRNTSGWATGGTLPSDQSRTYPNATTLATNNMTKSTTTDATYTVTFNYNGGTGSPTSATANKTTTYSANGWTTTEKSATQTHANGASFGANSTTNLYLYPCFTQFTRTSAVTLPTPARDGYTFKGWSTSSTATSGTTGTYTPTGNVTLYAIWTAIPDDGQTVSIIFPALSGFTTGYQRDGAGNYIHSGYVSDTYTGYGSYTECKIDGITVGSSWVTIASTTNIRGTVTRKAQFVNGTLTVRTEFSVTTQTSAAVKMVGGAYSTTAIFSGTVQYTVTIPALPSGATEIEYEVNYQGTMEYYYAETSTKYIGVKHGAVITPYVSCITGLTASGYGPWTITADKTIYAPQIKFASPPTYVSHSTTTNSITLTYSNPCAIGVSLRASWDDGGTTTLGSKTVSIAANSTASITITGLSAGTTYNIGTVLYNVTYLSSAQDKRTITTSSSSST